MRGMEKAKRHLIYKHWKFLKAVFHLVLLDWLLNGHLNTKRNYYRIGNWPVSNKR